MTSDELFEHTRAATILRRIHGLDVDLDFALPKGWRWEFQEPSYVVRGPLTDEARTALWPFVITIVYQRFFVVRTMHRDDRAVCIEIVSRGDDEIGFHVVVELIGD